MGSVLALLYTPLFYLALPFIFIRLLIRARKAPAYAKRWNERLAFGYDSKIDSNRSLVWVHAVSVGETEAAIPLIQELKNLPGNPSILVTSTTPTGSQRVLSALASDVYHVYLPYDIPAFTDRFIRHFKPDLGIVMETEIWPNLYRSCAKAKFPLLLANARLSPRSARGYQRIKPFVCRAFDSVAKVVAQTEQDAARFEQIGCAPNKIKTMGNIKFDFNISNEVIAEGLGYKSDLFDNRPLWIAASTHAGEDEILIATHSMLLEQFPNLILVLVPRHPERFNSVAKLIENAGLNAVRRTSGLACTQSEQVFLLDTMGELKAFYAASDIAFVGGSLVASVGGHNVLEPAVLGKPVLFGPHMFNFQLIANSLLDSSGAIQVRDQIELRGALLRLFSSTELAQQMGKSAEKFVLSNRGAIGKLMAVVNTYWNKQ